MTTTTSSQSKRTYTVIRDRWLEGLGREEMDLFADELSDAEILALPADEQDAALAEIGCEIEDGEIVAIEVAA